MPDSAISVGADGYYHPATETEIVALVRKAHDEGLQVRVRGAAHSIAHAIYTDPGTGSPAIPNKVSEQVPPEGPNINIMLDRYRNIAWIDETQGIVEVEAGIHLGKDPMDPVETASLESSLLYQAFQKGWTLRDLGGITHQTVGGFLSTGSSGGSLQFAIDENILALRVIDGTGKVEWVERTTNPDLFDALAVSLGLLGVISKVRFKLTPNFNIVGQEVTTPTSLSSACPIDLFGAGTAGKPSLMAFLKQMPYARLLWWPQKGSDRLVIWQATPEVPTPGFEPVPYREFTEAPELEELAAGIFFTIVGNLDDLSRVPKLLDPSFDRFAEAVDLVLERWGLEDPWSDWLAKLIAGAGEALADAVILVLAPLLKKTLPNVFPKIIDLFQPLTKDGNPKTFQDYSWRSLPMDNGVDDVMLGTEFTEIWIPLSQTQKTMALLKKHFDENGLSATGYFSTELYASKASSFWMSPSYGEPVFRVDLFWYVNNDGDPATKDGFYAQFWKLLRDERIPFRLHWGKYLPEYDYPDWAAYFRSQYPKWDDFSALREQRDPKNVFLTDYWRRHLLGSV